MGIIVCGFICPLSFMSIVISIIIYSFSRGVHTRVLHVVVVRTLASRPREIRTAVC